MSVLEVWWNERHVGQFVKDGSAVSFRDDDDAPQTPISLSIPRQGRAASGAADRWLRNLLPDNPRVLARWQASYQTAPATTTRPLARVGEIAAEPQVEPDGGSDEL